jgi:hypothetical protein
MITGNEDRTMSAPAKSNVASHRARMARDGFVRVEVKVAREDAGLLRQVAAVLMDPARGQAVRSLLRDGLMRPPTTSLKALLAAAPLDGITLERSGDTGRDVEL